LISESVSNAFSVKQIHFNFKTSCQIDRGHNFIKVSQNKFYYPKYVGNKKIKVFKNVLFKCATRPDLSGVALNSMFEE